jgi:hypothetical protein
MRLQMRVIKLSIVLLGVSASTAGAQRVHDFGFTAGMAYPRASSPQLAATMTLGVMNRDFELSAGSTSDDAFFAVNHVWRRSSFILGGGAAVYNGPDGTRPGIGGAIGLDIPIAPRSSAAIQLIGRGIAVIGATRWSLGAGIKLAPLRGGLLVGEQVAQPVEYLEVARSWDALVAQIMLMDNGASSIKTITATADSMILTFAPLARGDLIEDVARVARVLAASTEPLQLDISAPEPIWVSAAATSGGFPAERITSNTSASTTTIRVLREPGVSPNRSEQP